MWLKTERVRETGNRILKDEKRNREEGRKQRQPEYLKDREAAWHLHIFLGGQERGLIFPCRRKTRYKGVILPGEARETRNRNWGILTTQSSLFWNLLLFMGDNLKIPKFPSGAIPKGSSQRDLRVGGSYVETAPSLIFKEKVPSSSLKCTSELEWTSGLSLALLQLSSDLGEMFLQNGGDQPGWPDNTWTSGNQRCYPLGPLQSVLGRILCLDHRTRALAPASLPGNLRGRGGSVVSFPLHLGFFFHFTED